MRTRIFIGLLIATLLFPSGAVSRTPAFYNAVGTLFAKDESGSLRMVCTASAVSDLPGLARAQIQGGGTLLLTAAHCVSWAIQRVESDEARIGHYTAKKLPYMSLSGWSKKLFPQKKTEYRQLVDFVWTADEIQYYGVRVLVVGKEDSGYDFAVLQVKPAMKVRINPGSWSVSPGDTVAAVSNPGGYGKQLFSGYITMLSLNRPIVDISQSINWRGNMVLSIPSAPGSSGSLLLRDGRYIGVLIGVIQERFGAPFTVAVPIWKIQKAIEGDVYYIPIPPE